MDDNSMEVKSLQPYGTFQMLTIVQIVVHNKFFCRLSKNFAKNLIADLPKKTTEFVKIKRLF